ncbi:MAG: EAL domain-containing protein [Acidimicrobiia bacterium]
MGAFGEDTDDQPLINTQVNPYLYKVDDISRAENEDTSAPVLANKKWRSDALSLIHKISHDVIDETLVSPILNDIASVITSSFPITFAGIETYDGDIVSFSATSLAHGVVQDPTLIKISLASTLAGEVIRRSSTLILSDAHEHDYLICPSFSKPFHVYHYIGVPLFVDGKTNGVLSIATSHHIVIDKETIAWAETIGHHISALLTREAISTKLKSQEALAANMLNALSSPTMMCKKDGTIIHVNAAFRSIVEVFHSRTIDENSTNIFKLFDNPMQSNSYVRELRQSIKDLFETGTTHSRLDLLLTRAGFHRWYLATMSIMPDKETAIIMFVDISDRKQAEEQLEHEMLHDQSTGLANRILFHDRLNTTLNHNSKNNVSTCVLALEVGRYAFIVESLGYDAADRIISKVAKRLDSLVPSTDLIARVGSSEFAILIEHIHTAEQARDFALNIVDTFRTPFEIDSQEINLVPSVGIAFSDLSVEQDADMVLHDAHAAMTQARDSNVSRYSFASVSRSSEAYKKLKYERELHHAIRSDELCVFYQPEIELISGRIIGAEALVRWNHPKLGLLTPDNFIALAEESGLIDPLFERVFSQVVIDAQNLFSNGYDFTLWTNLSAKQFMINTTPKLLSKHVSKSDVPPYMFGIEITETAVMENSDSACETLNKLKAMGMSLALDDFGTGYSSLAYLQSFPVDIVKIDQTFISELGRTKASTEIVSAVIGLAHGLRLQALAEGVESKQTVNLLRELGCDLAQGYFYSHPLSFSKLLEFLGK